MRVVVIFLVLCLFGCNPEEKTRVEIEALSAAENRKYDFGLAYMEYVSQGGKDLPYAKTLLKKMLDMDFNAEVIQAAELLLDKFPQDPDLYYWRSKACRRLYQYELSANDINRALLLEPRNETFLLEAQSAKAEYNQWRKIQVLNEALANTNDSLTVLLQRADIFFSIEAYDAVLFDLGSMSKMRSPSDSIYFTQQVASLRKANGLPIEILTKMLDHFRKVEDER